MGSIDSFGRVRRLPTPRPGELLDLTYELNAFVANSLGIDEIGFSALVGDPFQVSGPGGFEVRLAAPAAVPEPSTLVLFALGLAAAGATRLKRRAGRRG
jgi:hypothetical protein